MEILSISFKNLRFQTQGIRIRNFEIPGLSHLEFEVLLISSEIPSTSKKV